MIVWALIVILAAIEITLAALVIRTLWRYGAPATHEPRTRKTLAPTPVSSAATPFATPGRTVTRSPGRVGARYVGGRA